MKTSSFDTKYCGVSLDSIQKAQPQLNEDNLELLNHWIKERYRIHIRKDVDKASPPWTSDSILKTYRFTNVRREQDRETKWLIQNIANSSTLSPEEIVLNSALFRAWNKSQTFEILGGPFTKDQLINYEQYRDIIEDYSLSYPQYTWYTSVFFTSGIKNSYKRSGSILDYSKKKEEVESEPDYEALVPIRMFYLTRHMIEKGIPDKVLNAADQNQAYTALLETRGLAQFLAYQIFIDLTYSPVFPFSENEFVVCGPGCQRGIDLIFMDRDGLTYEEALFWLRDHQDEYLLTEQEREELFIDLPPEERVMNVMSLENCMCEISKYLKAYYNSGRPKVLYKPPTIKLLPKEK